MADGAAALSTPASPRNGGPAAITGVGCGVDVVGAAPAAPSGAGGGRSFGVAAEIVAMDSSGNTSVGGGLLAWRHAPATTARDRATAPSLRPVGSGALARCITTVSPGPRTPAARAATAARHRPHSVRCRRTRASSFSVQRPAAMAWIWAGGRQVAGTGAVSPTRPRVEMRNGGGVTRSTPGQASQVGGARDDPRGSGCEDTSASTVQTNRAPRSAAACRMSTYSNAQARIAQALMRVRTMAALASAAMSSSTENHVMSRRTK